MSRTVLDTGALIALERGDRVLWQMLEIRGRTNERVSVPSTALAQAWRNRSKQARLARALAHCDIALFDPLARDVGVLCGRAGTSDICDAHVALVAAAHADVLYTSDPRDLERLLRVLDSDVALIEC